MTLGRIDARRGERNADVWEAIEQLRRRQDVSESHHASLWDELSGVRRGLEEVRAAVGGLRASLEPASAPERDPLFVDGSEPGPQTFVKATIGLPPEGAIALSLPALAMPEGRPCWLAPAIARLAERSPALAGELVAELVTHHGRLADGPLAYELRIQELGAFVVRLDGGRASVGTSAGYGSGVDFALEGRAAAFASLAGGGTDRRMSGMRVRGSRRKARRLFKACRRPLALVDLVEADVSVWPGLLLVSMAHAVDPAWTAGSEFVVAHVVRGTPDAVFVRACNGAPLEVSAQLEGADEPSATVYASERALLRMLAGLEPLADEQPMCTGEPEPVELLRAWFARAQGLQRSAGVE